MAFISKTIKIDHPNNFYYIPPPHHFYPNSSQWSKSRNMHERFSRNPELGNNLKFIHTSLNVVSQFFMSLNRFAFDFFFFFRPLWRECFVLNRVWTRKICYPRREIKNKVKEYFKMLNYDGDIRKLRQKKVDILKTK